MIKLVWYNCTGRGSHLIPNQASAVIVHSSLDLLSGIIWYHTMRCQNFTYLHSTVSLTCIAPETKMKRESLTDRNTSCAFGNGFSIFVTVTFVYTRILKPILKYIYVNVEKPFGNSFCNNSHTVYQDNFNWPTAITSQSHCKLIVRRDFIDCIKSGAHRCFGWVRREKRTSS